LGHHIYTEILGNGQVMMASSSSSSTGTYSASSTVEVSKEQWEMMKRPFENLRKNAPKPFNYEEIMAVES